MTISKVKRNNNTAVVINKNERMREGREKVWESESE